MCTSDGIGKGKERQPLSHSLSSVTVCSRPPPHPCLGSHHIVAHKQLKARRHVTDKLGAPWWWRRRHKRRQGGRLCSPRRHMLKFECGSNAGHMLGHMRLRPLRNVPPHRPRIFKIKTHMPSPNAIPAAAACSSHFPFCCLFGGVCQTADAQQTPQRWQRRRRRRQLPTRPRQDEWLDRSHRKHHNAGAGQPPRSRLLQGTKLQPVHPCRTA